ncbi:hypothetical protein Raf01_53860 [Rugosimonospora africana]|uniref:Uncharacterized protein n=1 Tax=Rugosimonospora africana TaxID=556532 RepID=A0A8J3VSM9_9ACTN|nr:hypothetical protein Raf01_53860 [Rugosimonospora africana]
MGARVARGGVAARLPWTHEVGQVRHFADAHGLRTSFEAWLNTVRLIDWLCEHWDMPDRRLGRPSTPNSTSPCGAVVAAGCYGQVIEIDKSRDARRVAGSSEVSGCRSC